MKYSSLLGRIEEIRKQYPNNDDLVEFLGYAEGYIEAI